MSGHSKWLTIKRQKGAADAARGQIFTKLSNAITIAVKQSGGISDPESNFKLRLAIDRARSANMPKENIERAIARAGIAAAGQMDEVLYEGFAPGGFRGGPPSSLDGNAENESRSEEWGRDHEDSA